MTVAEYIVIQSISTTLVGVLIIRKMIRANAIPVIIGIPINVNLSIFVNCDFNKDERSKMIVTKMKTSPINAAFPNAFICFILSLNKFLTVPGILTKLEAYFLSDSPN